MIRLKRVYAPPEITDGRRFLVDRLWPRGIKKEALRLDGWLKDAARQGDITLVYAARDERHNNAIVIKACLEAYLHSAKAETRRSIE